MRPIPLLPLLALLAAGCRRAPPIQVTRDPIDAAPKVVDATPPPEPTKAALDRYALVVGRVVDLEAKVVTHTFAPRPTLEAVHGARGYLLGSDGVLRAFDLASGAKLWAVTPPRTCRALVAGARHAYCTDEAKVTAFSATDGAATALSPVAGGSRAEVFEGDRVTLVSAYGEQLVFDAESLALVDRRKWSSPTVFARTFGVPDGACALGDGRDLFVACLDDRGKERWSSTFTLGKPGASTSRFAASHHDGFVLASGRWGSPALGVVVRLDGTEVARVGENVLAPIARPAKPGDRPKLEGLISASGKELTLLEPAGTPRWRAKVEAYGESGRAILEGDAIVLAIFHAAASGCQLVGLDLASGRVLWTGDVLQLPIAHSVYFNEVELERRPGGIVRLSGNEAGIRYEQLFEIATGKRVFAEAQVRW